MPGAGPVSSCKQAGPGHKESGCEGHTLESETLENRCKTQQFGQAGNQTSALRSTQRPQRQSMEERDTRPKVQSIGCWRLGHCPPAVNADPMDSNGSTAWKPSLRCRAGHREGAEALSPLARHAVPQNTCKEKKGKKRDKQLGGRAKGNRQATGTRPQGLRDELLQRAGSGTAAPHHGRCLPNVHGKSHQEGPKMSKVREDKKSGAYHSQEQLDCLSCKVVQVLWLHSNDISRCCLSSSSRQIAAPCRAAWVAFAPSLACTCQNHPESAIFLALPPSCAHA